MPAHPDLHPEPSGLKPRVWRFSQGIVQLGVWRATLWFSLGISLTSLGLTWAFLRVLGYSEMGNALLISLLVPLPLTLLTGGMLFSLLISLEKARRQAHALSMTDTLTGLSNRRHFIWGVQRELSLAQRHQLPLALLILDVDHFKRINDRFGHSVGDQVLVAVGQCCAKVLRTTDLLARWGGEEFVVLLPATQPDDAHHLAERVREAVAALAHPLVQGQPDATRVTVSVGVACAEPHQNMLLDELVQAADLALYDAKNAGRNRVSPAHPALVARPTGVSRFAPLMTA